MKEAIWAGLLLMLQFAIAENLYSVPQCFEQTPVFGSNANADFETDLVYFASLSKKDETPDLRVSRIVICG